MAEEYCEERQKKAAETTRLLLPPIPQPRYERV
jgi:hypothetical protein